MERQERQAHRALAHPRGQLQPPQRQQRRRCTARIQRQPSRIFSGNGTAHIAKFAEAGVIAYLFGAGAGGQSSHQNDTFTDNKLFIQSRAATILGGAPLALGAGADLGSTGHPGDPAACAPSILDGYDHLYEFETDAQKWTTAADVMDAGAVNAVAKVEWTTAKAFRGKGSLAVTFTGVAGSGKVYVPAAAVPVETPVDFHIWIPTTHQVTSVQLRLDQRGLCQQVARSQNVYPRSLAGVAGR